MRETVWGFVAAALVGLFAAAPTAITWDDVAAPLRPMLRARGLGPETFQAHADEVRRRNRERLREGDLDHLVYYTLQSTAFTQRPPIEPALSAAALVAAGRVVPDDVRHRIDDLVRALARDPGRARDGEPLEADERMAYFRDILRREVTRPEEWRAFLSEQYVRATQFFTGRGSYADRGLSTDTSVEVGYVVHLGLATLRRLEPERVVRRVLVVGPGLDVAPRTGLIEAGAPRSYQPFAVLDSLIAVGLSRAGEVEIVSIDINPRVVEWIQRVKASLRSATAGQARLRPATAGQEIGPRLTVVSGLADANGVRLADEYRAYLAGLGRAIGHDEPLAVLPAGHVGKTLALHRSTTEALDAVEQDVVLDRLDRRFDLAVVTNVFPYLADVDLLLAMSNIAAMLAPGGVLLHNEARPLVADACLALRLELVHSRSAVIATVAGRPPVYDAVWLHRAPLRIACLKCDGVQLNARRNASVK